MIRTAWVALVVLLSTLFFGLLAMGGALLRVRGRIYFHATQRWGRSILRASGTSVVTHGLEGVRWDAPQVLVCNHNSFYDVLAIAAVLPNPFSFVGKKELDSVPFFGQAWKAAGHISIDRSDRDRALVSLRQAGAKLNRERGTVILFPEGTRSKDGRLLPFKKGAFVLAIESGVPIVPAIILGSAPIIGKGGRIRAGTIHIHFGETVDPAGFGTVDELLSEVRSRMTIMLSAAGGDSLPFHT
ncbi:MAG: 1-acyl-sn-glycerol-3-phosphate acyltransferase [Gemmatimonadetes bacterium]|nr:1-acyl-sn-glycerol-3-phosphate acyltransferase [Gemmatimonadota bacterium]